MARRITLKFAGKCAECGTLLPVGSSAVWYGRGRVYGRGCHADTRSNVSGDGKKWWGGERVRASRCEDAPCCGCCGPQGDDNYYGSDGY